jgi:hypothetical protein
MHHLRHSFASLLINSATVALGAVMMRVVEPSRLVA